MILVVEDDKFTGRMMELQFKKHGYSIHVATNGEEAMELLREHPFDLVLSDVMMPRVSGLELLRKIRESYSKEVLPVILLTAMESSPKMGEALRLGASDFFTKPKEFGLTLARVALHIELKKARETLRYHEPAQGPAFRTTGDGLWNWNIARDTVSFSSRWKAILGFDPKELTPTIDEWFGRVHPEDYERFIKAMRAHHERKNPWFEIDYRMSTKREVYIWVHTFGIALFGKGRSPIRMVGAMCEITGQKEISMKFAELRRSLGKLQQDMHALEETMAQDGEIRKSLAPLQRGLNKVVEEAARFF